MEPTPEPSSTNEPPADASPAGRPMSVLQRLLLKIRNFIIGQALNQLTMAVIMFCLVRWMSREDYGKFAVAFGFQSTIGLLSDLGVSGCIVALSGERAHDPAVVGR